MLVLKTFLGVFFELSLKTGFTVHRIKYYTSSSMAFDAILLDLKMDMAMSLHEQEN